MGQRSGELAGPTRRGALALAAAALAFPALGAAPAGSLGALAQRAGVWFGASIEANPPAAYAALYAREARILTTDNALKFAALRPSPDEWRFAAADSILEFAAKQAMPVRGHALIWNENTPDWLKRLSSREIERVFDAHLETLATRFAGRLHSWDVVNEPFWPGHEKPGGYRDGPWLAAMGPAYVARAFRRVHALDPGAKLCLNEAHCESDNEWGRGIRPRLLTLIDELLQAGAPLHAVGLQGHLQPQWAYEDAAFQEYLMQIGQCGVEIYITELDVNDASFPADRVARDAAVAARYDDFLRHVLAVPQVRLVQTWQLADPFSWYRDLPGAEARPPRPLPFDANLRPKPARDAIARAFAARRL